MKKYLFVFVLCACCYSSFEEFQCGFDFGFRDEIKGISGDGKIDRLSVIPIPIIKPVTPIGMSDYDFGVEYGRKTAVIKINQRKNSWVKKQHRK